MHKKHHLRSRRSDDVTIRRSNIRFCVAASLPVPFLHNPHRYMPLLFVFRSGPMIASPGDMRAETIDFISAYCDRWCERCAFTDRCSAFACTAAIAMCGDATEGIELAVGRRRTPEGSPDDAGGERFLEDFHNQMPSDDEMAEFRRFEDVRRARVDASPVSQMARTFMKCATEWIDRHRSLDEDADPIVREAFQIVCWDAYLIYVKLCRALSGRMQGEEDGDDHPVQNDWNGSAKVALISIARSTDAWRALGGALGDPSATALGDGLSHLQRAVLSEFPKATEFRRPGFDDPSAAIGSSANSVRR